MIIRVEKNKNYTVISNHIFKDSTISARAKGVYAYMMTLPDDWVIRRDEVGRHFSEGRDAIRKAFKELEKKGYLEVRQSKDEKNKFSSNETVLKEHPNAENPLTENPLTENPSTENPTLPNTNIPNTNKQNTKYKVFTEQWNLFANKYNLQTIKNLSASRQKQLNTRLNEKDFNLNKCIEAIKHLDFWRGNNKRRWKVTFDWLIKNDTNYLKILEQFDNLQSKPTRRPARIPETGNLDPEIIKQLNNQ